MTDKKKIYGIDSSHNMEINFKERCTDMKWNLTIRLDLSEADKHALYMHTILIYVILCKGDIPRVL